MTGLGLAGIFCFRRDSVLAIPRPSERSSPRPSKVVLIINLNTSPRAMYGGLSRERAGRGGDSVVLLRERAHDEEHHEPQHELLLGR